MHDIWKDMFVVGLPLLEKVLRPIIVYAFLVVSLRLSGKRELVQLNPFDLVVLLTLSNTVQNAIIGEDNSVLGGLIGATSLLVTNYLVVRFLYDHRKLDQLVEGRADVLIEGGKVRTKHLKTELITMAQLEANVDLHWQEARQRGRTPPGVDWEAGTSGAGNRPAAKLTTAGACLDVPRGVRQLRAFVSILPLYLGSGFSGHRLQRFVSRRKRAVDVRESMCCRDKRCFKL